jgi:peroxiredoxin 5
LSEDIVLHEDTPANAVTTGDLFRGKKVILFAVPGTLNSLSSIFRDFFNSYFYQGAFTPGCSRTHLPGYIADAERYKAKGIDEIVCISVNDAFVTGAWKEANEAAGKIRILADTNCLFTQALGMELDATKALGSLRSKRYSAYVEDGEIKLFNLESDGTGLTCSLSAGLLTQI